MKRSTERFEIVEQKIGSGRCLILDGATGTELPGEARPTALLASAALQ